MSSSIQPLSNTVASAAIFVLPPLIMFIVLIWQRMDRAFWAAAGRNVAAFLGMMVASFALLSAAYYWAIPVLSFIFRHDAALATGALLAGIIYMWTHCAYENYKVEVALKRPHAGHNDLWLLFHTICVGLFATALAYINTQAMAHVALLWGMGATMNIMMYI
jgi:hypothetical protein